MKIFHLRYSSKFRAPYRNCSLVSGGLKVLAIRREDQSVWERRAPLAPHHVKKLVKQGVKVIVQPSNRRAYPSKSYANAGALVQEDIGEASAIFGVKQVPIDSLLSHKTFCFFSHTIKAQNDNMELLDECLEKNVRLIDYEKMVDDSGARVVAFGKFAGIAGMIDILHGLGLRLLALGHHTPFMHIGPAHNYRNSHHARQGIRDAGYEISLGMMPESIGPMTFVFTGSGNVSQGAQEIFTELPHEYVPPSALMEISRSGDRNKIYACEVSRNDQFERKNGGGYDATEFEKYPERYISNFAHKFAPYASVIVNGIYWSPETPRLLTLADAKSLLATPYTPWIPTKRGLPSLPHRLIAICDISADPGGSIEFMNECTTIDEPFCLYDANRNKDKKSFQGPGVLICSIDNMPTQLPREATDFFGDLLLPYVPNILRSNASRPFDDEEMSKLGSVVTRSVIVSNGKLTPNFEYISELRSSREKKLQGQMEGLSSQRKVLVLGAGYVSAPVIDYLINEGNVSHITVAADPKHQANQLAERFERVEPVLCNVTERPDILDDLIESHSVVISLLPYGLHPKIAKRCIAKKRNMVTASYYSQEMRELSREAKEAGICIVNECGVDPGIDHFLALECFDEVHTGGGKVESFKSYCGGLPAPENSDNPLGYKFSWSPRGVLMNMLSGAKYLKCGNIVNIESNGGLLDAVEKMDFLPGFNLEGYPNRDSTAYSEYYGIHEAHTILRGTLRYEGYVDAIKGLILIGLLNPYPKAALHETSPSLNWRGLLANLLGVEESVLEDKVRERVNTESRFKVIQNLGLLSNDLVQKFGSPLDTISAHLASRLNYGIGERDLILMHHEILIRWPDHRREKRGINLVVYGDSDSSGYTAMSKTVGYPAAIAASMVLNEEITQKGMILPFAPSIYKPLLELLKEKSIRATESSIYI